MNRVLLLGNIRPSLRLGLALLLALALLASPLAATPAAAAEKPSDHQYKERDNDDDNDDDNGNNNRHHKKKNNNRNNNNNGGGGSFETSQESEQDAESSDINQSVAVTSSGDNSTQCAGVQDVAQTGNAQSLFDLTQVNSEVDEVEAEEVGSTIDESPTNSTECTSQVNQAAAAADPPHCTWWVNPAGVDVCRWNADGTDWTMDSSGNWVLASNLATGALGTAGGLTTLGTLATLGLVGTGLAIRRTRSG